MKADLATHGFAILENVLPLADLTALEALPTPGEAAGLRGLLAFPTVAALAHSPMLLDVVRPHLAGQPRPVRGILFDKSPDANWLVPWHQDLTIAVRAAVEDANGFGPWSTKDGVPHVQPPVALLEQMITIRLHLDAADEENGALRVLPGTHRFGRLSAERIRALRREREEVLCAVPAGGALLMRPLLLHASSRSTSIRRRRVVHLEYAGFALPEPLAWAEG